MEDCRRGTSANVCTRRIYLQSTTEWEPQHGLRRPSTGCRTHRILLLLKCPSAVRTKDVIQRHASSRAFVTLEGPDTVLHRHHSSLLVCLRCRPVTHRSCASFRRCAHQYVVRAISATELERLFESPSHPQLGISKWPASRFRHLHQPRKL